MAEDVEEKGIEPVTGGKNWCCVQIEKTKEDGRNGGGTKSWTRPGLEGFRGRYFFQGAAVKASEGTSEGTAIAFLLVSACPASFGNCEATAGQTITGGKVSTATGMQQRKLTSCNTSLSPCVFMGMGVSPTIYG